MGVLDKQAKIQSRWLLVLSAALFCAGVVAGLVYRSDATLGVLIAVSAWLAFIVVAWWKTEESRS